MNVISCVNQTDCLYNIYDTLETCCVSTGLAADYLLVQHGFGCVRHDTLGVARLLAVDKDDAAQPADETHRAGVDQLLLGDHGAAVR